MNSSNQSEPSAPKAPSFPIPASHPIPTTLILVCCHAIFVGPSTKFVSQPSLPSPSIDPEDPTQWHLASFQATEAPTFVSHIRTGLELLRKHPDAILAFSGGATKRNITDVTEAQGYLRIAKHMLRAESADTKRNLEERMFAEKWATDSFQNVLFGILDFALWRGFNRPNSVKGALMEQILSKGDGGTDFPVLPKRLIIVSHEFKRPRFMQLHLPAIRDLLPLSRKASFDEVEVEYVGINPPFSQEEAVQVEVLERRNGFEPWIVDRYGVEDFLDGKRRARGWREEEYLQWWREAVGEGDFEVLNEVERMIKGKAWE